jgi:hypothetical protein
LSTNFEREKTDSCLKCGALRTRPFGSYAPLRRFKQKVKKGADMNLELDGDEFSQSATEADLTRCLGKFADGANDSFVILSDGNKYIQTCKSKGGAYLLEWQDGTEEKHFRCFDKNLTRDQLATEFRHFLLKGEPVSTGLPWEHVTLDNDDDSDSSVPMKLWHMIVLLAVVSVFLIYSIIKTFY